MQIMCTYVHFIEVGSGSSYPLSCFLGGTLAPAMAEEEDLPPPLPRTRQWAVGYTEYACAKLAAIELRSPFPSHQASSIEAGRVKLSTDCGGADDH